MKLTEMFTFEKLVDNVRDAIVDWEKPFDEESKYDEVGGYENLQELSIHQALYDLF